MREQLGRAEQRVSKLSADIDRHARSLSEQVLRMPELLAGLELQRARVTARREFWRTALMIAAATVGGFLAGQAATCRSSTSTKPTVTEESPTPKAKPSPSRRPAR
jgi:hypothetical protein